MIVRVLLIDAFPLDDPDRAVVDEAVDVLSAGGHQVDRLGLVETGFELAMSPAERAAYHTDEPLVAEETARSAELIARAEGLLFCYPTTTFTVPALLKGWLERVLVLGVGFEFDEKGRVSPGMTQIRRLGVVTTSPHRWLTTRRHRDLGRRTIMWTLRLNCHRLCRRTFVSIPAGAGGASSTGRRLRGRLGRW